MDAHDDAALASLAARVADEIERHLLQGFSEQFIGEWRRRCSRSLRRHVALHAFIISPNFPIQLTESLLRFWFIGVADGMDASPDEPTDG